MLISLCMIVKDEEEVLARCLNSVKDIVDEIIIVDTGSTDRTKEIALQYTEHIYPYQWADDFSAARNESIKRATCKWVLIMDADEYFGTEDARTLRRFLENETPLANQVYRVSVLNFVGQSIKHGEIISGKVARIFPNHFDIQFIRPIHEQLHSFREEALVYSDSPVPIYHTGYLKKTMESKHKSERNSNIFSTLKKNSGYTAYDYFTLGNEYYVNNDLEKAVYYYNRCLKKAGNNPSILQSSWYSHCIISLVQIYLKQTRIREAWFLVENNLSFWKDYAEYESLRGILFQTLGFYDEAKLAFSKAIELANEKAISNPVFWMFSASYGSQIPINNLIHIAQLHTDYTAIVHHLTQLISQERHDYKSIGQLIEMLLVTDSPTSIIQFMQKLLPEDSVTQNFTLLKISISLKAPELAIFYFQKISQQGATLNGIDLLQYYLLINDPIKFNTVLDDLKNSNEGVDENLLVCSVIASLIQKNNSYYTGLAIAPDNELYQLYTIFGKLLTGSPFEKSDKDNFSTPIYRILVELYQYKKFDIFDELVNRYQNPVIINLLANYFYSKGQFEISLNYYSILLREQQLNGDSCENLAWYHINKQLITDGLEFLEMAIEKKPNSSYLYVLYIRNSSDQEKIKHYKQVYATTFPQFITIPIVKDMLHR